MGVTAFILLSNLGFAIIAQAQQCSKPLGGPNMQLKDEFITQETFADGSIVSFKCDPGYTTAGGSSQITCTKGVWSPVRLTCERKNCGALDQVLNGDIEYKDGTLFGDRAVVVCNQGYRVVGPNNVRCDVSGWVGRLPTCEVVQCLPPAGVVNGSFSPQNEFYDYRAVVRYSCNKNLVLNGSRELICSEDGKFSPAPPKCVWVECKDPVIENAEFQSGSRPPHVYKATVTYSCKPGYDMVGSSTLTCNLNSQWSSPFPKCTKKQEPTPPTTTTTTTTTTTITTDPKGHGNSLSPGIIALIALVIIILIAIVILFIYRKKRKSRSPVGPKLLHVTMSS